MEDLEELPSWYTACPQTGRECTMEVHLLQDFDFVKASTISP